MKIATLTCLLLFCTVLVYPQTVKKTTIQKPTMEKTIERAKLEIERNKLEIELRQQLVIKQEQLLQTLRERNYELQAQIEYLMEQNKERNIVLTRLFWSMFFPN